MSVLSLIAVAFAEEFRIARLDMWESSSKSKKVFSYKEGAKLSPSIVLSDNSYIEVELTGQGGAKVTPAQVALLFAEENPVTVVMGSHPSVQVPLKKSAAGGSIYRGELNLGSLRTMSPRGGLCSVRLVAGDLAGTLMHSLGKVMIPRIEHKLNTVGDGIKELSNFLAWPEIHHIFKSPAAVANPLITNVFTFITVVVPVMMFMAGLGRLQLNIKGISNVTSAVFFSLAGSFVVLLTWFFAALNLVQTVAGATILAVPLCIVGNRLLRQVRTSGDLSS